MWRKTCWFGLFLCDVFLFFCCCIVKSVVRFVVVVLCGMKEDVSLWTVFWLCIVKCTVKLDVMVVIHIIIWRVL